MVAAREKDFLIPAVPSRETFRGVALLADAVVA